jgi:hypothetical protein
MAWYDVYSEKLVVKSRWYTNAGVRLGSSLSDLITLNGKDFTFLGLGWDYGGGISNWKGGKLENKKIFVRLGIDEMTPEQEKYYPKIVGDSEFSSENPAARKVNPLVFEVILSKE